MSGSGSFYVYTLGYIVVVYCISLWRGVSVNDTYYYYYYYYYSCIGAKDGQESINREDNYDLLNVWG
jgi:hypothetical protein